MYQNKGFTLIELLVVVLIIGILAAVALPQYQAAVDKARFSELVTLTRALFNAQQVAYMEQGRWPAEWDELSVSLPAGGEASYRGTDPLMTFSNGNIIEMDVTNGAIYGYNGSSLNVQLSLSSSGSRLCCAIGGSARAEKLCKSLSNTEPTSRGCSLGPCSCRFI